MTSIVRFADDEGRVANPLWVPISDEYSLSLLRTRVQDKIGLNTKDDKYLQQVSDAIDLLETLPKRAKKDMSYQSGYYNYQGDNSDVYCMVGANTFSVRTETAERRPVEWGEAQILQQYEQIKAISKAVVVLTKFAEEHELKDWTNLRLSVSNLDHVKRLAAKIRNGKLAIKNVDDELDFAKNNCFALYCAFTNDRNHEGYVDASGRLGTLGRARTFESKLEAERFANKHSINSYYPSFQVVELNIQLSNIHHSVPGGGKQQDNFSDSRFRGVMARLERAQIEAALKHASYDDIRARMEQLEAERDQLDQGGVEGNAPERKRRM